MAPNTACESVPDKLVIDLSPLEPLLKHPATKSLESKLGTSIPELFEYLFLSPHPYDSICFCSPGWKRLNHPKDYGIYCSRAEMHMLLYTYILKRSACIPLIQTDGYEITREYTSKTDAAFMVFFQILISNKDGILTKNRKMASFTHDIPKHGRTVMLMSPKAHKAFRIFTREPMKFTVQKTKKNHIRSLEGNVVVCCEDIEPKGYWNMTWETMRKPMASCVAPDENYVF